MAGGHQRVAVAIEPVAGSQHVLAQPRPLLRNPGALEDFGRGRGHLGTRQFGYGRRLQRRAFGAAVVVGLPGQREEDLAGERLRHQSRHRTAIDIEADQRAPDRHAGDEGTGAVDRVYDPGEASGAGLVVPFLADDGVVGEALAEQLANRQFCIAVRLGHRVEAHGVLVVDRKPGAEPGQGARGRNHRRIQQGVADQVRIEAAEAWVSHIGSTSVFCRAGKVLPVVVGYWTQPVCVSHESFLQQHCHRTMLKTSGRLADTGKSVHPERA